MRRLKLISILAAGLLPFFFGATAFAEDDPPADDPTANTGAAVSEAAHALPTPEATDDSGSEDSEDVEDTEDGADGSTVSEAAQGLHDTAMENLPEQAQGHGAPDNPGPPDDLPEVANVPDLPDTPGAPDLPDLPEVANVPDLPDLPEAAHVPDLPDVVGGPGHP